MRTYYSAKFEMMDRGQAGEAGEASEARGDNSQDLSFKTKLALYYVNGMFFIRNHLISLSSTSASYY